MVSCSVLAVLMARPYFSMARQLRQCLLWEGTKPTQEASSVWVSIICYSCYMCSRDVWPTCTLKVEIFNATKISSLDLLTKIISAWVYHYWLLIIIKLNAWEFIVQNILALKFSLSHYTICTCTILYWSLGVDYTQGLSAAMHNGHAYWCYIISLHQTLTSICK